MLQRSPSYVLSVPANDPIASLLDRLLPTQVAYAIVRWKNVLIALVIYRLSRRRPETMRRMLRRLMQRRLPPGYDIDTALQPPL